MRVLFLLLLPLCYYCQPFYTIFMTADVYHANPAKSPDTICAESDGNRPFEYRAIVKLSNRRNFSELFISGYQFTNHDGSSNFTRFSDIFLCNNTIYAPNGSNDCSWEFWSGYAPNLTPNCLDFTTPQSTIVNIGKLSATGPTDVKPGSCGSRYHYLCARGDNFALPRKDVVVFLSHDTLAPRNASIDFDPEDRKSVV